MRPNNKTEQNTKVLGFSWLFSSIIWFYGYKEKCVSATSTFSLRFHFTLLDVTCLIEFGKGVINKDLRNEINLVSI